MAGGGQQALENRFENVAQPAAPAHDGLAAYRNSSLTNDHYSSTSANVDSILGTNFSLAGVGDSSSWLKNYHSDPTKELPINGSDLAKLASSPTLPIQPIGDTGFQPLTGPSRPADAQPSSQPSDQPFDPTTLPLDGPRNYGTDKQPMAPMTVPTQDGALQTNPDGSTVLTKNDNSTVHTDQNHCVTEVDRANGTKEVFGYDKDGNVTSIKSTDADGKEDINTVKPGQYNVDADGTVHAKGDTGSQTTYTDGTRVDADKTGKVQYIINNGNVLYSAYNHDAPKDHATTWTTDSGTLQQNTDGSSKFTEGNGTVIDISKGGQVSFEDASGKSHPGSSLESNGDPQVRHVTGEVPVPAGLQ